MGKKSKAQKKSSRPTSNFHWRACKEFGYAQELTYPSRPESFGFPPVFREIEFSFYGSKPEEILVPQDLIGLTLDVVWYESSSDRIYRRNPFEVLSATVKNARFLDRNSKDTFLVRRDIHSRYYWRIEIELFEHIEPSSIYGKWARIQGDNSIGVNTNTLEMDFYFNRIPDSERGEGFVLHAMKKGLPCAPGSLVVQDMLTSSGIKELTSLQLDSAVFIYFALKAGISGLGVKSFPFLKFKNHTRSYLGELSRKEEASLDELKVIFGETQDLRLELESLMISCDSPLFIKYQAILRKLKMQKREVIEIEGEKQDTVRAIEFLKKEIAAEDTTKKVAVRTRDQERFKRLFLLIENMKDQIKELEDNLASLEKRLSILIADIEEAKTNIWRLEGKLEIAAKTNRLAQLQARELEIMAILDSLFVDRIRITAGQYAYQCKAL